MNRTDDLFAHIADRRETEKSQQLVEPQPPTLPQRYLPATKSNPAAAFKPLNKIDTPEKLARELERQRKRHAKFLRNLAPAPQPTRQAIPLETFDWRLQTATDAQDFAAVLAGAGDWQSVHIPHYGGPIGKATAYYRTTFHLDDLDSLDSRSLGDSGSLGHLGRSLFIRFKGVDYKAHVFVNGAYLGSHEGFFAPFEFDFTRIARAGDNVLLVVVENDAIMLGNDTWDKLEGRDEFYEGDKVYAATGPGWDDPQVGWHHCPPGMGIYQDVCVEVRAPIHIHDLFVRPVLAEQRAEAWIEVYSSHPLYQPVGLTLSLYGQNFEQKVFENRAIDKVAAAGPGVSYYRFSFDLPNPKVWDLDTPWLYQLQVRLLDPDGTLYDNAARQFGMRSFRMDTTPTPLSPDEKRAAGAVDAAVPSSPSARGAAGASIPPSPSGREVGGAGIPPSPSGREVGGAAIPPSPSARGAAGASVPPSPSGREVGGASIPPSPSGRGAGGEGNLPSPSGRGAGGEGASPLGRMYLNDRPIRLRGANTMGFEQQDVVRKDWDQLRDDILLAKLCNMNYWRITQRPVQDEVYEMCDRLGFLTQSDLPLFGQVRRNQFAEVVRQAEEMERLVRSHPCNIMVSYINEPFPNASGKAHRHLTRPEMESFFEAADRAVHLANPDRVTKAVDGDYDPPGPGLPDNHCYTCWYNGHGVELGKLHKGFWQKIKPSWMYGCGEFGAEGLDTVELMRKYYPPAWLPQSPTEEPEWTPNRIVSAQTGRYHYMFFETPHTLENWSHTSRRHQAWATRIMTEAFRRDSHMNSCAIHLFIDAFPDGWMKVIMDYDRQPKPSYFAYREALTPLMANIRTDRSAYFAGEDMLFELWVCNDTNDVPQGALLRYQVERGGKVIFAQQAKAKVEPCTSTFQGFLKIKAPGTSAREKVTIRLALAQPGGKLLHDTAVEVDVFAPVGQADSLPYILGPRNGTAAQLAHDLGLRTTFAGAFKPGQVILVDDINRYAQRRAEVDAAVQAGAVAVFLELPAGEVEIAGDTLRIDPCGMGGRHFVSRDTGHPLVKGFEPEDFKFWYDPAVDRPAPLLETVIETTRWAPILMSGNGGWEIDWHATPAAVEKRHGSGAYRICQVKLAGRLVNPVAGIFARRLVSL